ncbi:MAG: hypothetical protein HYY66_04510 [Candidatus Tectomicrobia bacterium]|nr:hypothetical protein [Candidatus Tectomicrobia bacterium]
MADAPRFRGRRGRAPRLPGGGHCAGPLAPGQARLLGPRRGPLPPRDAHQPGPGPQARRGGLRRLLDPAGQGKFVSDLHLYRREAELLALLPPGMSAPLAGALDHFIIMDQVEVKDCTEALCALGVFGPGAPAAVRLAGLPWPDLPEHGFAAKDDALAARELWTGEEGCVLLAPAARAGALWDALAGAGARPAGLRAFGTLTLEAGVPLFGPDMGPEVNPMQAGIEARALDFQKGCYIGQEVIAKIKYLGQVNRGLAGIRLEGGEAPPAGAGVWRGEEEAGEVTRSALSPTLGRGIAFAYLHRKAMEPGTALRVRWPGGEGSARVVELPFYRRGGS